jgi:hypothetical protein
MKTNTFVGFASLLLVVVYLLVMRIQPDKDGDMTRFIPDSALMYLEQHNGTLALKEFAESPLGKKFASIDFMVTGREIGMSDSSLATFRDILSAYDLARDEKLVDEIIGKRFGLAILAPVGVETDTTILEFIKANSVVVAEPQHSAKFLEFLGESYTKYGDEFSVTTAQYGNHHIKRIKTNGEAISVVTIDGFFIISLNEIQLRRCIDTFDEELVAVAQNKNYLSIREDFGQPDRFFYLPIESAREFAAKIVTDLSFTQSDLLLKELKTTVGFSAFGYGAWRDSDKVVDKIIVRYDSDQVNSLVRNHLSILPIQSSMMSLTTENPMAYYWSNTFNFNHFLLYFNDSSESDPRIIEFMSRVESITGKSVEEILSLLGDEVSLVLEPGSNANFFPFPLGTFFVKVKAAEELATILDQLIDAYNIPVSTKLYGPVRYTYWTPSPQDGLQPLYGFWNDRFFFGNSSSLLRSVVDKNSVRFSLSDIPAIRRMDPGISEKNNSITYLNDVELIRVFQKLLNLVGTIVGIEDKETANKIRVVIDEIINPLLDGATMFDKSVTRSYFTPEKVVIDSVTNIPPGGIN